MGSPLLGEQKNLLLAGFLCLLIAFGVPRMAVGEPPLKGTEAGMILHGGKIITVDASFSVHQAVAIRDGRFLAVGSDQEVLPLAGPGTKVIDLKGKAVIPGLIDDHYHMLNKAVDAYLGADVTLVSSIAEMLQRIKAKADQTPAGHVVYTTSGWVAEQLKEGRIPNRTDLDSVSTQHPIVVQGGHTLILNSLALEKAGITGATPSPPGGIIGKDASTGEPTGLLVDNAMSLAGRLIPGWQWFGAAAATHEQKLEALRRAMRLENSVGITGVREPGIPPEDMRVYEELWNRGELTLRVSMNLNLDSHLPADTLVEQLGRWGVSTGFGNSYLKLDGIGEFGIDGGFEAALMSTPYPKGVGGKEQPFFGLQRIPTDKFETVLKAANRFNWRGCVHSAGDRATDIVLDAYEKADHEIPLARKRWILEHGHYTRADQFPRIKKLGVAISTQFHPYMAAKTMRDYWGPERASKVMRVRDWLDAGLTVGGGSDWSLLPANPFWMLYFWITRDTRLWGVFGADQKVSREEALRMMTINNAYITFDEHVKGSIEPGKLADLVIISDDILTVPESQIRDIKALLTMVGGKIVYSDSSFPTQ